MDVTAPRTAEDARLDPRPGDTRHPAYGGDGAFGTAEVTKYTVLSRVTADTVRVSTEWSDGYVMEPFDYPVRLWSEGRLCTWTAAG